MNERLVPIPIPSVYPGAAAALGNLYVYLKMPPVPCRLVFVEASPNVDDPGLTLDIDVVTGSSVLAALSIALAAVPGTWISKHFGGANEPISIAANALLSFDANAAANATIIRGTLWVLTGEG